MYLLMGMLMRKMGSRRLTNEIDEEEEGGDGKEEEGDGEEEDGEKR